MSNLIWKVDMASADHMMATSNSYRLHAESAIDALERATKMETESVAELSKSEGENFKPDVAIAVNLICATDD